MIIGTICLLLASCKTQTFEKLPPDKVLSRAAQVGQDMESASFNLIGSMSADMPTGTVIEGEGTVNGRYHKDGQQSAMTVKFDSAVSGGEEPYDVKGEVEVVSMGKNELFFFVHSMETDSEEGFFNPALLAAVAGSWWHLPSQQPAQQQTVSPDPRLLHAQAEVVEVLQDKGITTLNDRPVYHYETTIDVEKLVQYLEQVARENDQEFDAEAAAADLAGMQARGDLWIDAETFFVHALEWDISSLTLSDGQTIASSFRVDLQDHNDAEPVTPPTDAQEFSPFALLGLPSGSGDTEEHMLILQQMLENQ